MFVSLYFRSHQHINVIELT